MMKPTYAGPAGAAMRILHGSIIACLAAATLMATGCAPLPVSPAPGAGVPAVPVPVPGSTAPAPSPAPVAAGALVGTPLPPAALAGWATDDLRGLASALARQCAMLTPPAPWSRLCPEFRALQARADGSRTGLRGWLEARFMAWPLLDAQSGAEGLITGYYEPLLTGSRIRERPDQVPLYARPTDLLTIDLASIEPRLAGMRLRGRLQGQRVVPYFSRAELATTTALAGQELVWVDDPIDAFFLEIQGSGRVALRDGSTMRVGYADQNGHPYRAIGRTLIDQGALRAEDVSAPAIRDWLRANPAQASAVMHSNPSAVFFRELPAVAAGAGAGWPTESGIEAGPPGSLGVPLTGLRSIAVDRRIVPLASLVWLDTSHPIDNSPVQRAVLAQDTGGAITGKIRADVFWGFGPDAGRAAGLMKSRGRMWVLWPKEEPFPAGE